MAFKIDSIHKSKSYGEFKILKYHNSMKVDISFVATGYKTTVRAQQIKIGSVKDLLMPVVYGVGFIGVGKHTSYKNGRMTKVYTAWSSMMKRCYCPKYQKLHPTYKCVVVDRYWHNFQNFADWYADNYIVGYQLDKDMKSTTCKVYSCDTCHFITQKSNIIEAVAKHYTLINPKGLYVNVYNLTEFCRNNSLHRPSIHHVISGKYSQYNGWTNGGDL